MAEATLRGGLAFLILVTLCGALLGTVAALTGARIDANHARRFAATISALSGGHAVPQPLAWHGDQALLCDGAALLRGSTAGYGGPIEWLAAAEYAGNGARLRGVRITAHHETPGIADFLNTPDGGWLGGLGGRNADGLAAVDAVTGATITSRALRRALAEALRAARTETADCRR